MITIDRWYLEDRTLGLMSIGLFRCCTLELPDKFNEQDISCIPSGTYDYYARTSPKNGLVLELRNVPDRDYIQIHSANYIRQLLGCIAVGDGFKFLDGDNTLDVTNSKATLKKVLELAGKSGKIKIRG